MDRHSTYNRQQVRWWSFWIMPLIQYSLIHHDDNVHSMSSSILGSLCVGWTTATWLWLSIYHFVFTILVFFQVINQYWWGSLVRRHHSANSDGPHRLWQHGNAQVTVWGRATKGRGLESQGGWGIVDRTWVTMFLLCGFCPMERAYIFQPACRLREHTCKLEAPY